MAATGLMLLISSGSDGIARIAAAPLAFLFAAFMDLALLSVWMFIIVIIIRVIFSWMGRNFGPPAELMNDLTEPLVRPIRRLIPPLGIIDLSTYITLVLLIALSMALGDFRPAY